VFDLFIRVQLTGGKIVVASAQIKNATQIDQLCINTIRTLSMDAVQQANSGHPGIPMALAPIAYCLWQQFLRFDPDDPIWATRDRFILSNGHASMLLYSLLHLCSVKAVNAQYEEVGTLSVIPQYDGWNNSGNYGDRLRVQPDGKLYLNLP